MHLEDSVYGGKDITDKIILDILKSRLFGRLKKISMHGVLAHNCHYYKRKVSVYEHSVGSFLLARILGASLSDQMDALLFPSKYFLSQPRCLAYLYNFEERAYNFSGYDEAIDRLIKPYGMTCHQTMESFKEPWPKLTLPRLDMILRDCTFYDRFDICVILDNLNYQNGKIIFKDEYIAREMTHRVAAISSLFWENPFVKLITQYFDMAYYYAKEKHLLRTKVFSLPLDEQFRRLKTLKHPHFQRKFKKFLKSRPSDFVIVDSLGDMILSARAHYIDPYILEKDNLRLLSEIDKEYQYVMHEYKNMQKQIHIHFL